MTDPIGLLIILAVFLAIAVLGVRLINRYDSEGDLCDHGKRTADGEVCRECGVNYESEDAA